MSPRRCATGAFLLLACVGGAGSCSSIDSSDDLRDAGPASCEVAPACPEAGAPSYSGEIERILGQYCVACHGPGGTAGYDESTYAAVYAQFGSMLSQVAICAMPPLDGPQLTSAQRVALTAWLKCGAPDN